MEREDNNFDNYSQTQNLMENLQIASGGGGVNVVVGGGVGGGGDCGGLVAGDEFVGHGGVVGEKKYKEHEEHENDDHGECKYIKEVQQSEKFKVGGGGGETDVGGVGFGNLGLDIKSGGVGGVGSNGSEMHAQEKGEFDDDDDDDAHAPLTPSDAEYDFEGEEVLRPDPRGYGYGYGRQEEEQEVEIIKNDGDFSSTSNATTTDENNSNTGGRKVEEEIASAVIEVDLLPVEQKIPSATGAVEQEEEDDDDEPSSLATNGTSSLSGDLPASAAPPQKPTFGDNFAAATTYSDPDADKENVNVHSPLNPDAAEFVPSFGGAGTSPSSPLSTAAPAFGGGHHATTLAQHHRTQLLSDGDDLVASSPRKGRGSNMDAIALPAENEFEQEANERPQELEQEADDDENIAAAAVLGNGALPPQHQQKQEEEEEEKQQQLPTSLLGAVLENGKDQEASAGVSADILDFELPKSPESFIDHGPETSVDLFGSPDADVGDLLREVVDPMKQSIYIEHDEQKLLEEPIEQLLNTVQPLPTSDDADEEEENETNSLVAEAKHEEKQLGIEFSLLSLGDKELLNVEEKEHVSHSPSTEEMGDLLQEINSAVAAKDIPQLPRDEDVELNKYMNNASHMEESFYLQHTAGAVEQLVESPVADAPASASVPADNLLFSADDEVSFVETSRAAPEEAELFPLAASASDCNFDTQLSAAPTLDAAPTHDLEVQLVAQLKQSTENLNLLETKMDDMLLSSNNDASAAAADDGHLLQAEDVAEITTTIADNSNPFFSNEEFQEEQHQPQEKELLQQTEISQHEQTSFDEFCKCEQELKNESTIMYDEVQPKQLHFDTEPAFEIAATAVEAVEAVSAAAAAFDPFAAIEEPLVTSEPAALPLAAAAVPKLLIEADLAEPAAAAVVEVAESAAEAKEEIVVPVVAAVAATAVVAAVAAAVTTTKKPEAKKPAPAGKTTASAGTVKPKVNSSSADVRKLASAVGAKTTAAPRPRTAPASAAKRTAASNTAAAAAAAAKPASATTARRPLTASGPSAGARTGQVTRTAAASAATAAAKPASVRNAATASTAAAARKPVAGATTTNGIAAAARSRPATAPAKPTTLGLAPSAAAKPKLSSPRGTLTSQLRKPPVSGTIAAAKSPTKPPSTNGVSSATKSTTTTSTLTASRTKTAATTASSNTTTTTTTTKTFTARPAPKTFSHGSGTGSTTTTTTTRRLTLPSKTPTTTTSSSSGVRKTASPMKPLPGRVTTPSKAGGALKTKPKDTAPPKGSTPIRIVAPKTNGAAAAAAVAAAEVPSSAQVQLNGGAEHGTNLTENGGSGDADALLQPASVGVSVSLLDA